MTVLGKCNTCRARKIKVRAATVACIEPGPESNQELSPTLTETFNADAMPGSAMR
jgi:hypothetical protein